MSPLAWFLAGGITSLVVARWFSRLVFRHWWLILAAVFLGVMAVVTGKASTPAEWIPTAVRLLADSV